VHACAFCSTTIVLGGRTLDGLRFCGDRCALQLERVRAAQAIAPEHARALAAKLRVRACSACAGPGPLDLGSSRELGTGTRFRESVLVCRACGTKRQLAAAARCLVRGWCSGPWGLLTMPLRLLSQLEKLLRRRGSNGPSELLVSHARYLLADALLEREARARFERQTARRVAA